MLLRAFSKSSVFCDWGLWIALFLGTFLRIAYLWEHAEDPEWHAPALDAAFHDYWAHALVSGDWSPPRFHPDPNIQGAPYFRPPGYSWFLAGLYWLVGRDIIWVRTLQMLLGLLNLCLGYKVGLLYYGRPAARLVAFCIAVSWPLIYFEGELLSPVLVIFFLMCVLLAAHACFFCPSVPRGMVLGILLGVLALVLPNALLLAPVLCLSLWKRLTVNCSGRLATKLLLPIPLGLIIAVAPATVRNYLVSGELVLITSNAGVNLYIGNNPEADGFTARIPLLGSMTGLQGWTCFDQPAIVRGVERVEKRSLGAGAVSAHFASKAWQYIRDNPMETLTRYIRKCWLFLGPIEVANNRELEVVREDSMVLSWLPGWSFWFPLAIFGCAILVLPRNPEGLWGGRCGMWIVGLIFWIWVASYLPFFVAGRYRAPLLPILALFAAPCIEWFWRQCKLRCWRKLCLGLAVLVPLFGFARIPVGDYRPDRSNHCFQRADAYRMLGKSDLAIEGYRESIALAAGAVPVVYNNLGSSLLVKGEYDEALKCLLKSVELSPSYSDGYYNLGLAFAARGADPDAIRAFRRAVALNPDNSEGWLRLGAILLRSSEPGLAIGALRECIALGESSTARYLLSLATLDSGDRVGGQQLLAELVAKDPLHADARVVLAEILVEEGRIQQAERFVGEALRINPGHQGALALLRRLR